MNRLVLVSLIVVVHAVVIGFMMFVGDDSSNSDDAGVEQNQQVDSELPESGVSKEDPVIEDLDGGVSVGVESGDTDLTLPGDGSSHKVAAGESLSVISKKYYGTSTYYLYIYEANRDKLKSPQSLRVGQVLVIPKKPN